MNIAIRKTTLAIMSLILVCVSALDLRFSQNINAYANNGTQFESINVLEDLQSSTAGGKTFNAANYPRNPYGKVSVITFVEYCYSFYANGMSNYGLYVYVYNPALLNLSENIGLNKIQIADSFNAEGSPNNYSKYQLEFCNKSEGDYYKLFYKYKVIDTGNKVLNVVENYAINNNGVRRYHISGIELLTAGETNAKEYNVATTYEFSGFAEGYGSSDFPLTSNVYSLETIELNVKHTFYRTKTSSKGAGYQNQLDTVYFAVPKRLFNTYGNLQKIKAEWYEYKTKDIIVTSNNNFYNAALPYIGVQTGDFDSYGMTKYNKSIGYSLGQNAGDWGDMKAATWGWNLGSGYLHPSCAIMYYLFLVSDISNYDPYADITSIGGVESNRLYDYIKSYNKSYVNGKLSTKNISADLFESDIDDYRKLDTAYGKIQNGYSYYDFDADIDLQKLTSWKDGDPSFWDNWANWGLWNAMTGNIPKESGYTVSPIYTMKAGDLNGTKEEVSERLLVNGNDVEALRTYYDDAVRVTGSDDEEKVVVLFRFATSDYYSAPVDIIQLGEGIFWSDKYTKGQAYRAWESVFFDFDIIQLTFFKDGVSTVIPVVSSPIDIINGITPPVVLETSNWWQMLLAVLMFILFLILFWPLIPHIISFIVWLFKCTLKILFAPIKGIMALTKTKNKEN